MLDAARRQAVLRQTRKRPSENGKKGLVPNQITSVTGEVAMAFEPVKFFMTPGNVNKPVALFLFGGWLALAVVAAIYKGDLGISFQGLLALLLVLSLVVGALAILPRLP